MPTITITVDLPDETAAKIAALPEPERAKIAAAALQAEVPRTQPPRKNAEETAALFARWNAEDEAAGVTQEEAEAEWQQLAAGLNKNRLQTGEEPLF